MPKLQLFFTNYQVRNVQLKSEPAQRVYIKNLHYTGHFFITVLLTAQQTSMLQRTER